ncbi:hypothetical protein Z517_00959 [Fonsecaea pedrosoi CBS 271.37]|uniref:Uncharacterized protein n=1 Tax=Fonsecaea pedrosoi CBS 271.37 TaxID=1442368 RepID=A0A0D2FFV1_9EURO|nr:uncharacterized protein Z517_00959 [Fonsecaea pedrosoi CBS 271.37]KIW85567.1 hypothetical protein Z517_00959 [Fonsecaea pedrosoi CBS 271.37]
MSPGKAAVPAIPMGFMDGVTITFGVSKLMLQTTSPRAIQIIPDAQFLNYNDRGIPQSPLVHVIEETEVSSYSSSNYKHWQ